MTNYINTLTAGEVVQASGYGPTAIGESEGHCDPFITFYVSPVNDGIRDIPGRHVDLSVEVAIELRDQLNAAIREARL